MTRWARRRRDRLEAVVARLGCAWMLQGVASLLVIRYLFS